MQEMLNEAYRLHFIFRGTLSSTTGMKFHIVLFF